MVEVGSLPSHKPDSIVLEPLFKTLGFTVGPDISKDDPSFLLSSWNRLRPQPHTML